MVGNHQTSIKNWPFGVPGGNEAFTDFCSVRLTGPIQQRPGGVVFFLVSRAARTTNSLINHAKPKKNWKWSLNLQQNVSTKNLMAHLSVCLNPLSKTEI